MVHILYIFLRQSTSSGALATRDKVLYEAQDEVEEESVA